MSAQVMIGNTFLLDGWTIDVPGGRISRGSDDVRLEPQVMKVLVYLAERPMTVIPREDFLDNLWGPSFVGDAALTRCIYEIRNAFGDNPREPKIVETVPKSGFRLIATPEPACERNSPDQRRTSHPALIWATAASLALLVFVLPTESNDLQGSEVAVAQSPAAEVYFKALQHFDEPTRVSNKNAIAMFEKAITLDANFSLAYSGLADALSQESLYWGGQQTDRAYAVAMDALRLAPNSPQSQYALGMAYRAQGDKSAALELFNAVAQLSPDHTGALYNIADIYRERLEFGNATDYYLAVTRIDPAHASAMKRLGFLYLRSGDLLNARIWIERVIDDSPLDAYASSQLATLEMVTGNSTAALDICEPILDLYPADRGCLRVLGTANFKLGNYDAALRWFEQETTAHDKSRYSQLGIAQVLMATNQDIAGRAIVEDVLSELYVSANTGNADWSDYWMIAACLALKGDADTALVWLDKAADAGRRFSLWDSTESAFTVLHGDRRFQQYVSKTLMASNEQV